MRLRPTFIQLWYIPILVGMIFFLVLVLADWRAAGIIVRTVKTQDIKIAYEQRSNQVLIARCWDMDGMPVLNKQFLFEGCHLRKRP
jgi:hypothetical protein